MNDIHPTAIIDSRVELGKGNKILPNTIIYGPTIIGDNNIIGPNVVIGMPGQDTRDKYYDSSECRIEIGNNNIIREFTSIQKPCYENLTKIGNEVFIMQSVHVPHDAIIHDEVVITPMCVLAGITKILRGANIGISSSIHQHSVIGHYTLIGMGSAVNRNVKPFSIYVHDKKARANRYAITKFGFEEYTDEIVKYVQESIMPMSDRILAIVEEFEQLHRASKRPLYQ